MRLFLVPVVLAMFASTPAFAHAHLTGSTPAAETKLAETPAEVVLDLSEALEPNFSVIEVDDAKAARHKGDLHIAPDNANRLAISVGPLASGLYKVVWHVTSTDTHKTEGSFSFTDRK